MAEAQANQEQIQYWNVQSGPQWVRMQQRLDAQLSPLGLAVMQRAEIKSGEQVLDVGCGCGQTALELAQRVGPNGSVLGIDISQPMLARARDRQSAGKIENLEFLCADAQTHLFERERFDLICSRFGVMFFDDPPAAFGNLRSALRPNGRLCFICWQGLERNDWIRVPLRAAAQHIELPTPPLPDAPGPFALADPDRVRRILEAAGFRDVRCEAHETELSLGGATNVDEGVEFLLEIGPIATLLREAEAPLRARVAQAIREALAPHVRQDAVSLHGETWIVFAQPQRGLRAG